MIKAVAARAALMAGVIMLCMMFNASMSITALADETNASGVSAEIVDGQSCEPLDESAAQLSAQRVAEASAAPTLKTKKGNLARFANLGKHVWLLAMTKGGTSVYKTPSTKGGKLVKKVRYRSCLVVSTKNIKPNQNYKWLKVKLAKKKTGYIRVADIKFKTLDTKTFGLDLSKKKNRVRASVCRFGLPFVGTPWANNKNSMRKGINCYNFVYRALTKYHVKVKGRSLKGELASGKKTTQAKLKPGDLVFYRKGKSSKPTHVAIYLGNNLIINASGHFGSTYPNGGIRISHIDYRGTPAYRFRSVV